MQLPLSPVGPKASRLIVTIVHMAMLTCTEPFWTLSSSLRFSTRFGRTITIALRLRLDHSLRVSTARLSGSSKRLRVLFSTVFAPSTRDYMAWTRQALPVTLSEDTLPSLLRLITASRCSLTRLVLAEVDISHELIPVLQHTPMLDSLEMYFAWWSNPLDRTMQLLVTAMMESKAAPAASPATPFRPAILPV